MLGAEWGISAYTAPEAPYHWAHRTARGGERINSLKAYSKIGHRGQLHKEISILNTIISGTHYLFLKIYIMGFKYILRKKFI